MISKYFLGALILIVNLLLLSSCLNSSDNNNLEYPSDPQIYAISIVSATDTTNLLPGVFFTIDQVNGKLFNKTPLPYGFHVDSVALRVTASSSFGFSKIEITLEDSIPYLWNVSDSIPISRLQSIRTTAPDGLASKKYDFQLNIYQEDPYILKWEKIEGDHPGALEVENQKTIIYKDRFLTYYRSGDEIKAEASAISNTPNWEKVDLFGIPHSLRLSTILASGDMIHGIDEETGGVYQSADGSSWNVVQTEYEVKALYGELPFSDSGNILLAVMHEGILRFARANNDLSDIELMNELSGSMPITDFSAMKVEGNNSYASKFLFLAGGYNIGGVSSSNIWILQEEDDVIKYILSESPESVDLEGSSLFFYDDKPYLITILEEENILMYSDNYGMNWIKAGENQSFPSEFAVRTNSTVITDVNNNIWIFGGISSSNAQLVEIWKGRLNKFALD